MNTYGQIDFENDFNEYSAMIFTYQQKFRKIMNQCLRLRSNLLVCVAGVLSWVMFESGKVKLNIPCWAMPGEHSRRSEIVEGKLESIILDEIVPQYGKDVNSVVECLMKIAEDDIAVFPSDGLVEQTAGQSTPDYIKCISNGALGEVPGDRVEFD